MFIGPVVLFVFIIGLNTIYARTMGPGGGWGQSYGPQQRGGIAPIAGPGRARVGVWVAV